MIEQSNKTVSLRPTVAASLHRRTGIHDRRKITISLLLTSLLILTGYTLTTLAPAHFRWGAAVASFVDNVRVMMISPSLGNDTWSQLMAAMGETVGLAILTTLIGVLSWRYCLPIIWPRRPLQALLRQYWPGFVPFPRFCGY
ncbi:hypothetical protein [Secundilactobacillus kimchicus]|uniref:hypothetical protein n=1 Tax=Secundilactobacillus kimchicus TaxID=528209 RepID=UPI0024A828C4|nr:hypothetical protein [Secundilactobacillus kimchicus]